MSRRGMDVVVLEARGRAMAEVCMALIHAPTPAHRLVAGRLRDFSRHGPPRPAGGSSASKRLEVGGESSDLAGVGRDRGGEGIGENHAVEEAREVVFLGEEEGREHRHTPSSALAGALEDAHRGIKGRRERALRHAFGAEHAAMGHDALGGHPGLVQHAHAERQGGEHGHDAAPGRDQEGRADAPDRARGGGGRS